MTENDDDIESLTQELQQLTIERNRIERRRKQIAEKLHRLNRNSKVPNKHHKPLTYLPLDVEENRADTNGHILRVNDRVRYLSRGIQQSSTGKIESFGKRFVVTRDEYGRQVNKEPHRVRKLSDSEE